MSPFIAYITGYGFTTGCYTFLQIVHGYLDLRTVFDTFPLYTWTALFPINRRNTGFSIEVIEFTYVGTNAWFKSGTVSSCDSWMGSLNKV